MSKRLRGRTGLASEGVAEGTAADVDAEFGKDRAASSVADSDGGTVSVSGDAEVAAATVGLGRGGGVGGLLRAIGVSMLRRVSAEGGVGSSSAVAMSSTALL